MLGCNTYVGVFGHYAQDYASGIGCVQRNLIRDIVDQSLDKQSVHSF